ncbi:hypothetical protein [Geopseudomonas aromaticivorans]
MDREQLITSMCTTWRHDYGLDKREDTVLPSSGMTPEERAGLRRHMEQIFNHHIAPLLAQIPRWRRPDEDMPKITPQQGWWDTSEPVLIQLADQEQVVATLVDLNPGLHEPLWCCTDQRRLEQDEVIAWMPLPASTLA